MRDRILAVFLLLVIATSLVFASAYGKLGKSKPIKISLLEKPPKELYQGSLHSIQLTWEHTDKKRSTYGQFIFILQLRKGLINPSDLMFRFNGSLVVPVAENSVLVYQLPSQFFPAEDMGKLSVDVIYKKPIEYLWEIGVIEIP